MHPKNEQSAGPAQHFHKYNSARSDVKGSQCVFFNLTKVFEICLQLSFVMFTLQYY